MLKGYVDVISSSYVSGWCCDTEDFQKKISINIFYGESCIGSILADEYRKDLSSVNETADFAFTFHFTDPIKNIELIKCVVPRREGNYTLPVLHPVSPIQPIKRIPVASPSHFLMTFGNDLDFDYQYESTENAYLKCGQNTGNLAFVYAASKFINNIHICKSFDEFPSTKEKSVILTCANFLGSHSDFSSTASLISKSNLSYVALGLGGQGGLNEEIPILKQGTMDFVNALAEKSISSSPNIALRGNYSMKIMTSLGLADRCEVLGCPSLFINPNENLGDIIYKNFRNIKRVAVAAGNFRWEHLRHIEQILLNLVINTNGAYIGQQDISFLKLCRCDLENINSDVVKKIFSYSFPGKEDNYSYNFFNHYAYVFFDVRSWMEFFKHYDFCIGSRIHGIMLALQSCIPALCIVHDARTKELCDIMKIPYVLYNDLDASFGLEYIQDKFSMFNFKEFDENRLNLKNKLKKFLENNYISSRL